MSNDNNDYEVSKVYLKDIDFYLLVLKIPQNDLEDKLAYLAREKGQITQSFYEDFAIATCIANINQLLFHMNQQVSDKLDVLSIRKSVMDAIIKVNPLLSPDKLAINRNYVIKIREDGKLKPDEKPLTDNKKWSTSYYDEIAKVYDEEDSKKKSKPPKPPKETKKPKLPKEALKDIDELDTYEVKKWWRRIGQYIVIKKFDPADEESVLRSRFFHSRISFNTFVVSICVENFEDLFKLLDNMGISNRVSPHLLMQELYELCRAVNTFLTFENAQALSDNPDAKRTKKRSRENKYKTTSSMSDYIKKESKKRFKDIPKKDLLNLGTNMKVTLIGQDKAIDEMVSAIQRASVGLKDPDKPIGSFLFAGRTGVGKTYASKILADELIKERDNLIIIDCSEYSSDHEYAKLIGAPAGYIGHEQGGILTNSVGNNPFSVVLFDEIEKASHKVHELLLQVLEEGRLTDGKGNSVSFRDTVIILTSNIGVDEVDRIGKTIGFGDVAKLTEDKKDAALDKALKKKFKPEFLNRLDNVIHFRTLNKKDYMRIIDLELHKLNDNLKTNDTEFSGLSLKFDSKIRNLIYKNGIDDAYGARPLKRCIETTVSTPLALNLLKKEIDLHSTVLISAENKKAVFKFKKPKTSTENDKSNFKISKSDDENEMTVGV